MVDEKRKTTVPIPPVGADGEQPILNTTTGIITGDEGEINSPDEISQENFLEFQRLYDRLNNPAFLHTVTLSELYETSYPSRPPIIDGLLYPGTYLLAGAPKVGKSFLVAQLAYHISTGQPLWDYPVRKSTVLYLALEDDYKRLQDRMFRMFGVDCTEDLYFATCAKQIGNGLEDQLELFLKEHPNTRLVIVYHYHLHVVYVPVVEKQILWSKRCKDKSLVGTVKETIMQVSSSKKWQSQPSLDENGNPILTAKGKPILKKSYVNHLPMCNSLYTMRGRP